MITSLRYVKESSAPYYYNGLMSYKTQALTHVFWHTYWDDKILPTLKERVEETIPLLCLIIYVCLSSY
jgi:hypothetical protein